MSYDHYTGGGFVVGTGDRKTERLDIITETSTILFYIISGGEFRPDEIYKVLKGGIEWRRYKE